MNKTLQLLMLLCCAFLLMHCKATKKTVKTVSKQKTTTYRIGFYNVENLFDTLDNPLTEGDDFFTPQGRNQWNTERYNKKLNDLARIIDEMGQPVLMGLSEVENESVCRDICKNEQLADAGYAIIHEESPDFRGIDVALLYQKKLFRILETDIIRINFPKEVVEDYTTRDILYVKGVLNKKDTLHIFVNHWPSRRGGLEASEPKRLYVARQLSNYTNNILKGNPKANIVLVGDFNDEPSNKSIVEGLSCKPQDIFDNKAANAPAPSGFFNCMDSLHTRGIGTYNYRGNWNMLDHVIVSSSLKATDAPLQFKKGVIFQRNWMMYKHDRFGLMPSRTYGGPNYYGGFSDHLPVYAEFIRKP